MQKQQLTVDGKDLGRYPKSSKLKKLAILKGIEVRLVEETKEERATRLQAIRDKRKFNQQAAIDTTPSLIDGILMIETFRNTK